MESITVEKPTLRMINSEASRTIAEWEELYRDLSLLIEVTREDFSQVFEGRLVATAEDPVELIEPRRRLGSRGIVSLTTKGVPPENQPAIFTLL